jgi:hypothetical protein
VNIEFGGIALTAAFSEIDQDTLASGENRGTFNFLRIAE